MKKKKGKSFWAYAGFSDGKPFFWEFTDQYGKAVSMDLYKTKKEARKRFGDVRKVLVVYVQAAIERKRKGR